MLQVQKILVGAGLAAGSRGKAEIHRQDLVAVWEIHLHAIGVGFIAAMQEGEMAGVETTLERLEPVAFLDVPRDVAMRVRNRGPFEVGESGLFLRRSHVGPHDAAALDARVGSDADLVHEAAAGRLARHVDALALDVEFPAVIDAAQPAFLVAAEEQGRRAMGTALVQQPDAAGGVAERDQPLAQELDADRRAVGLGKLLGEQRRYPIAPHEIAHRRSRTGPRQQIIFFGR